jgi:hypothetical protein
VVCRLIGRRTRHPPLTGRHTQLLWQGRNRVGNRVCPVQTGCYLKCNSRILPMCTCIQLAGPGGEVKQQYKSRELP